MNISSREMALLPTHDPVVGFFLGKLMQPRPKKPMPAVMIRGQVDSADFTFSANWDEDGMSIVGRLSDGTKEDDLLSTLNPKVLNLEPMGGFWGAAEDMRVKSVMEVGEEIGGSKFKGTHSKTSVSEDQNGQTDKMETKIEGDGLKINNSLLLYREKKYFPYGEGYNLAPKSGEVSLEIESEGDKSKSTTPNPLSLQVGQDGSWKVSGEMVTQKEKLDPSGQVQKEEVKEPVERIYRLLKMPFIGVPYVEVESKIGKTEAHYFIAPIPYLRKLAGIVSEILSRTAGKEVSVPPYKALEEAKKLSQGKLSRFAAAALSHAGNVDDLPRASRKTFQ